MRRYLNAHVPCPDTIDLPPLYGRLFALTPVDDRRFFTGRHDELERLIDIHRHWLDGGKTAILIDGAIGSGKSSLLNVFHMDVEAERLLRLDGNFGTRGQGVMATLASELDCDPSVESIHKALSTAPTAVLIDGAERWFEPTLAGVSDLDDLKHLIALSDARVLWVVSVQSNALDQFERLMAFKRAFSHRIALKPVDAKAAREIIEARHRLSGFDLAFTLGTGWKRLAMWRRGTAEDQYFHTLARTAKGNLRAVLYSHLRSVSITDDDHIVAHPVNTAEVPFLGQLSEVSLVALIELLRLGTMERHVLERTLKVGADELQVHIESLRLAGLLEQGPIGGTVKIPRHLREVLTQELFEQRRLVRGVS